MGELLEVWTEDQLRTFAAGWRGANYCPGELGDCDPQNARWAYEPHFDVTLLAHLNDWADWFADEVAMDEREGMGRGYRAMLTQEIEEPIVVLVVDGKGYIWDGWHRTGATLVSGRLGLRAIVGRLAAC